jgi:DNA-binding response OmpR family regulator
LPDKILVAGDGPDILNLVETILERAGFQVVTASDGEEVLRKAEAPDLILLDVVKPGKSGLDVCKILKGQAEIKHMPVVMLTALGRDVDRKLGADCGADGHFTEPFTSETLIAEIERYLRKARGEKFSRQLGISARLR